MELPVKTPLPNHTETDQLYNLKTKNLSYILSPRYFEPINWFSCNTIHNTKYILKNVTCEAKPGELTAIVGPSGAGKTTLLEILAGMIVPSKVSGQVLVNDLPINVSHFRRVSGYVTQDEALFPLLTVEETLTYSARLRLKGNNNDCKKTKTRVQKLMKELGLDHIAGVRVGSGSGRGISGGERRRVSIGVDLVHDPSVLLLDEPTSGLDSASALHVVSLLKSMVDNQRKTVILTIHQPGFRILDLLDRVVLLSDGVVLHNGSLSHLGERLKYVGHDIPRHVNVLEFAIDVRESLQREEEENDVESCETDLYTSNRAESEHRIFYCRSPFEEVLILSQRFASNVFRTKQLFAAKTIQSLLAGIVMGTIFIHSFNNSKRMTLQSQIGFFAFTLTFLMSSTTEALPIFLQEREILMRETARGAYRVSSYVIANTAVFLPFLLLVSLLYTIPVYWLVHLRREIDGFLYFSLVVWMVVLVSNSFVAFFSALLPNFIMAMSVISTLMGSFFLFSGYFISKDTIPKWWSFMEYLSLYKYPFECFMVNEFGGEKGLKCLQGVEGACLIDGNQFLMHQGVKDSEKWSNLFVMLGFIFGYRFLGFLLLWYRSYRSRS